MQRATETSRGSHTLGCAPLEALMPRQGGYKAGGRGKEHTGQEILQRGEEVIPVLLACFPSMASSACHFHPHPSHPLLSQLNLICQDGKTIEHVRPPWRVSFKKGAVVVKDPVRDEAEVTMLQEHDNLLLRRRQRMKNGLTCKGVLRE
eukprot:753813-Hanusia_phi.AAC.4